MKLMFFIWQHIIGNVTINRINTLPTASDSTAYARPIGSSGVDSPWRRLCFGLDSSISFFSFTANAGHSVNSVNDKFHHGKISCLRQEPIVGGSIKKNILWNCYVTALGASPREKTRRIFTRTSRSSQLFRQTLLLRNAIRLDRCNAPSIDQSRSRMIDNRDAVFRKIRDKKSLMDNETSLHDISLNEEYILDRTDVRVIFITLYSIVFVFCFIGNSMVIFVVTFSRRLRSITNFFLANLAVADFCVGIFCVYQTLTNYLMNSWRLGDFLCKVYMFVHALSYTASVLILMVVCIERYLAIVYPIKCRSVLTRSRLQLVIGIVWIIAAIYALPRFFYVETMQNRLITGDVDIICIANIQKHNKTLLDAVNLVFLYLLPLLLMCCLYTRIAVGLWRSGTTLRGPDLATKSKNDSLHRVHSSSRNVLRARRGVIRMLIAVVMMFAVCNLPQQARIAWRHWSSSYDRSSNFSTLLTLSTFLISYTNSCLNPFLYAFLSRNFQKGIRELLNCGKTRNRNSVLVMGRTARETATRQENDEGNVNDFRRSLLVRLSSDRDSSVAVPPSTEQTIYDKSSY